MARYEVGSLLVDTATRELRAGDGELLPLEPRAFDLLLMLIENRDRAVSKQELLDQVWEGRMVTDGVLTQAVAKARKVLSGATDDQIKTVHRVGYRFVGNVIALDDSQIDGRNSKLEVCVSLRASELARQQLLESDDFALRPHPTDDMTLHAAQASDALKAAIEAQRAHPEASIGIHIGEADPEREKTAAISMVSKALAEAAIPGQILMSATAFEFGRAVVSSEQAAELGWLAHGQYRLQSIDEVLNLYEVGLVGQAPMESPPDTKTAFRALAEDIILGWRAAAGQTVPHRPHWVLIKSLGEGGFGEAWLAEHDKTHEKRVFKFCYRADRLRSLQREVTLFRLLNEALGQRPDIARLLDWNFEEPPYFVESEYTGEGDLLQWVQAQGGLAAVPLQSRFGIFCGVAQALGAAHAVGVLHKDVKPSNILIKQGEDGAATAVLCDFGIGLITDESSLDKHDITRLGVTEALAGNVTTSRTGTRRYMAPEILEGKTPTIQADMYSLGVVLYQLVIGDFERVLAPGWERDVKDDVLRGDIAALVEGDPLRRQSDARQVAERIIHIEQRRTELNNQRDHAQKLAVERRRRRVLVPALIALVVVAAVTGYQALRISQEAERAKAAAKQATQVSTFLQNLFEAPDPFSGEVQTPTVMDLLEAGAEQAASELQAYPAAQADLLRTIGLSYSGVGNPEEGLKNLEVAAQAANRANSPLLVSKIKLARGRALITAGNMDAADHALRQAIDLAQTLGQAGEEVVAESQLFLAGTSYGRGEMREAAEQAQLAAQWYTKNRPDEVIAAVAATRHATYFGETGPWPETKAMFEKGLALFEANHSDTAEYIVALKDYAFSLNSQRDYELGRDIGEKSLELAEQRMGEGHFYIAYILEMLIDSYREMADYETAEAYARRAIAVTRDQLGEHKQSAIALDKLSGVLMASGRTEESLAPARESLEIMGRLDGVGELYLASNRFNYANRLAALGRYNEALPLYEASLATYQKQFGPENRSVGQILLTIGFVQVNAGVHEAGLQRLAEGLKIVSAEYGAQHWSVANSQLLLAEALNVAGQQVQGQAVYREFFPILLENRPLDSYEVREALRICAHLFGDSAPECEAPQS